MPARRSESSITDLQRELNRLFDRYLYDDAWLRPFSGWESLDEWFGDAAPTAFRPEMDLTDEGDHLKLSAELPGMEADDIKIELDNGVLMLHGEKKVEKSDQEEGVYRTERRYGSFYRSIPLPTDVDAERVQARFKKGVLTVRLPKIETEETRKKRIPIAS